MTYSRKTKRIHCVFPTRNIVFTAKKTWNYRRPFRPEGGNNRGTSGLSARDYIQWYLVFSVSVLNGTLFFRFCAARKPPPPAKSKLVSRPPESVCLITQVRIPGGGGVLEWRDWLRRHHPISTLGASAIFREIET